MSLPRKFQQKPFLKSYLYIPLYFVCNLFSVEYAIRFTTVLFCIFTQMFSLRDLRERFPNRGGFYTIFLFTNTSNNDNIIIIIITIQLTECTRVSYVRENTRKFRTAFCIVCWPKMFKRVFRVSQNNNIISVKITYHLTNEV